ncbi:MAG: Flp pilus assembly protein CpaB [Coriobacteriales bacterium]|nr:Flp pilus assembly protein CpaB [Coriobacteriales bacterium]
MTASKKRLVLSLVCGAAAALLLALYASGIQAQALSSRQEALTSYGGEQVEILVTTRDIAAGETLSAQNVSKQLWLADLLPAGALIDQDEVFGQTAMVPFLRNEPIVAAKLGETAPPVSVPEGLCAVSIPSADVLAVGGAIAAGSEVCIYAVGASSVVLLERNVLVLETSNGARASTQGASALFGGSSSRAALSWVTLAVQPQRVQELLAASRDQSLYLVLPGEQVSFELSAQLGQASGSDATAGDDSAATPADAASLAAASAAATPADAASVDATFASEAGERGEGNGADAQF